MGLWRESLREGEGVETESDREEGGPESTSAEHRSAIADASLRLLAGTTKPLLPFPRIQVFAVSFLVFGPTRVDFPRIPARGRARRPDIVRSVDLARRSPPPPGEPGRGPQPTFFLCALLLRFFLMFCTTY